MDVFIRSRLLYNAATWDQHETTMGKLEVEWVRQLRKIVRGGFKQHTDPDQRMTEMERALGDWDYACIHTNKKIYELTGRGSLKDSQEQRHIEWLDINV